MRGSAPDLAGVAALIGEPARARMLSSLMSGRALTATELALEAEVSPSTASAHLAKLTSAKVLAIEKQGRHRYFRLFDESIAELLEDLGSLASSRSVRTGPTDPALRRARVCYDHLAGEEGVWLYEAVRSRLNDASFFASIGIDLEALSHSRRPLIRLCLDWSERRHHLGGTLGAAVLARILTLRWAKRDPDSRAIVFSASGEKALRAWVGVRSNFER